MRKGCCKIRGDIPEIGVARSLEEWYLAEEYPAMSHPAADPLAFGNVARKCGLEAEDPAEARILEIGCGSGHHLISLANRWPGAVCEGIEPSRKMIARGRERARRAGIANVRFYECGIGEFKGEGRWDYIIAHGIFSWVADEVKIALMDFMGKRLERNGVGLVSFNVAAGWRARIRVVEKVRAIQSAGETDEMTALAVLWGVVDGGERAIVEDMLAKGPQVLAFDDFAPVMDAWSLGAVEKLAAAGGLVWMGDSRDGKRGTDREDTEREETFRTEIFRREDSIAGEGLAGFRRKGRGPVVPDFPKLDGWRLGCAREGIAVVDGDLKPCLFPTGQLRVLAHMDGTLSVARIAVLAAEIAPGFDCAGWLRELARRGMFEIG